MFLCDEVVQARYLTLAHRYPGARVDSQNPIYALSLPEVYKTWSWSQQYPGWEELQAYFKHVDKQLDISKDVYFSTKVLSGEFDANTNRWTVTCNTGKTFKASFLLPGIGFAAKRYVPDWPGQDKFQGEMHHSSFWPDHVEVSGKDVAVIGTGATGVQVIQEWAKEAKSCTVFQRTPNHALPMRQAKIDPAWEEQDKLKYDEYFKHRLTTDAGFAYTTIKTGRLTDLSEDDREKLFEKLWQAGGFSFLAAGYADMVADPKANRLAYDFWARKVRARIHDARKRDLLAPLEPVHPFVARRPSLEQDYYDLFNKDSVDIIDTNATPVESFVEEGIVTSDGKVHKFDTIALCTGFDAVTGGLNDITLRGLSPTLTLSQKWSTGVLSYLGLSVSSFPNLFYLYGPQAPTAFSNGPSCAEPQADWIVKVLVYMRERGYVRIDAKEEKESEWRDEVERWSKMTLRHGVRGWWFGSNVPGKRVEPLNWAGGLPLYIRKLGEEFGSGLGGFELS